LNDIGVIELAEGELGEAHLRASEARQKVFRNDH